MLKLRTHICSTLHHPEAGHLPRLGRFITSMLLFVGLCLLQACESATELDTPSKRVPSVISPIETQVTVLISEFVYDQPTNNWMWNHDAAHKKFRIDTIDGEAMCTAELQLVDLPLSGAKQSKVILDQVHMHLERMRSGSVKTCYSTQLEEDAESFVNLKYLLDLNGELTPRDHMGEIQIEMQELELPDDYVNERQVEITFSTDIQGSISALRYKVNGTILLKF